MSKPIRLQTLTVSRFGRNCSRQLPQLPSGAHFIPLPYPPQSLLLSKISLHIPSGLPAPPYTPPNLGRAAAKRPIWRFCNLWIWRSGRVAPRCGAFVGYGLGPTTISKAAHDSRTPIAGSKSEIGTYQYSKRFAPFDLIDLLLWSFSPPNT